MINRAGKWIFLLLMLCLFFARLFGQEEGLRAGVRPPDFELQSINGGKTVALHDFVGRQIVVIHFWKSK